MKTLIISISSVLFCLNGLAQLNQEEQISVIEKYDASQSFDELEPHFASSLISTNILSWAVGDIHFKYEHKITSIIALEFGAGIVKNTGVAGKLVGVMTAIPPHNTSIKRLGYSVGAKFYTKSFPKSLYFGIHYRNRPYFNGEIFDFYYDIGYQLVLDSQFLIGLSMGNGYRWINYDFDDSDNNRRMRPFRQIFPFSFALGYLF